MKTNLRFAQVLALAAVLAAPGARASNEVLPVTDVVKVDLAAAALAAAGNPQRYATSVAHSASLLTAGVWTESGPFSTWTYSLTVPGAENIAFRAEVMRLPAVAELSQSDLHGHVVNYSHDQLARADLWSRVSEGSTLTLKLTVPTAERGKSLFVISAIQPGFADPGLNAVVPKTTAAAASPYQCQENYSCHVQGYNSLQSRATMGIVIANTEFCSATLVSDVSLTFKNYILTAAHCDKGDASTITFYWQARTPCGQAPESIYSAAVATSSGAVSRMEYQDTWLVEALSAPPAGAMPYWVGVDASDNDVTTGTSYAVHYAAIQAAQYVETTQGLTKGFTSSKSTPGWLMTNTTGSTSNGASGSALIGPTGRLIGNLAGGINACPGSSATNSITWQRVGTVWVGDGTSSGGLKPWLDPANTGSKLTNGGEDPSRSGVPVIDSFTASSSTISSGSSSTLSWSVSHADKCVLTPDSQSIRQTADSVAVAPGTTTTYDLTCTSTDGTTTAQQKTITVTTSSSGGGGGGGGGTGGGSTGSAGGGGGGSEDLLSIALLLGAAVGARRRRRAHG